MVTKSAPLFHGSRSDDGEPIKLVDHPGYRPPQLRTKWVNLVGRLCFGCCILVIVVCGCIVRRFLHPYCPRPLEGLLWPIFCGVAR